MPRRLTSDDRKRVRRPAKVRARETATSDLHISVALHEHQMAQVQLRVRKYQDLYDRAPVGYVTLSDYLVIQESNLTAVTLLGMERGALAGESFDRFLDRDDIDRWQAPPPHRDLGTGEARTLRLGLRRSDGFSLPAHVTCQVTLGHDGRPGVRVVITDISEQVDVEDTLRRSQERLSAVLDDSTMDTAAVCRDRRDGGERQAGKHARGRGRGRRGRAVARSVVAAASPPRRPPHRPDSDVRSA